MKSPGSLTEVVREKCGPLLGLEEGISELAVVSQRGDKLWTVVTNEESFKEPDCFSRQRDQGVSTARRGG